MAGSTTGPSRTTNGGTWVAYLNYSMHYEASALRVTLHGYIWVTDGFSSNQNINWSSNVAGSGTVLVGTQAGYYTMHQDKDVSIPYGSDKVVTFSVSNGGQTSSLSYTFHAESLDTVESQVASQGLTLGYNGRQVKFTDYSPTSSGTLLDKPAMWAAREGAQFPVRSLDDTDFSSSLLPVKFCSEDYVYAWIGLASMYADEAALHMNGSFLFGKKNSGSGLTSLSFFKEADLSESSESFAPTFSDAFATFKGRESDYVRLLKYYRGFGCTPYRGPTADSKGREYFTYNDLLARIHLFVQHYNDTTKAWESRYFYLGFVLFYFDQFAYAFDSSGKPVIGNVVVVDEDGTSVPVDVYVYDADGVPRTAL